MIDGQIQYFISMDVVFFRTILMKTIYFYVDYKSSAHIDG